MMHRGFETPSCMVGRPVDRRGFPVPWFVTEKTPEGDWDFAAVQSSRWGEAIRNDTCWVSGTKLGRYKSFVIGPMCVVNRIAGDPPVRLAVAEWSVKICPFLSRPMARRDRRFDADTVDGIMSKERGLALARNPGVVAIYTTDKMTPVRGQGSLLQLGDPTAPLTFWREGREATPSEVWEAVNSGMPKLYKAAAAEGPDAIAELYRYFERACDLLPDWPGMKAGDFRPVEEVIHDRPG